MRTIELTKALLEEGLEIEDSLLALQGGYYDTHDLISIEKEKEYLVAQLKYIKDLFGVKDEEFLCNAQYRLILKLEKIKPKTK